MVLYRTESIKRSQFHLKCCTCGKKGKSFCIPHQIRGIDLKQVQDIRIVYCDIGMVDNSMEKGEQPVHVAAPPWNIDELIKMLA